MRVGFVYVPLAHHSFQENLRVVDEDFGRLPPLSLLYAAAIAQKAGHEVLVVDANCERLDLETTERRLRAFGVQVLACTLSTYMFQETTTWLGQLRKSLGVPVIAGGINPRLYPEETAQSPAIDHVVIHFGTRGFPALLDALERGVNPAGLPEVVTRGAEGTIVMGSVDPGANPYLELPRPARHLIDNRLYHSFISQRRNFTVMVTGTGCPFQCSFCAIAHLPRYENPLQNVLGEIRECVERYGVHEIDFFDADMFANRSRAFELCEGIRGLGLDLEWSCRSRIDLLDEKILTAAREAGCRQIYLGIETPDPGAQRLMRKRIGPDAVREALERMNRIGIRPLGFFMLGVPGETVLSALRTIRYAMDLPLDYAQFSRMIPKPGSEIHRELVRHTGSDPWKEHVLGETVLDRLPNIWSRIDETTVERLTKLAYLAFYYRPGYIYRALRRIRSTDELRRSVRTALRMLSDMRYSDRG